jgi:hypothetical protein
MTMNVTYFCRALSTLRPGVEWVLKGSADLSSVRWPEGVTPPSQQEIDAEILRIQAEDVSAARYKGASNAVKSRLNLLAQAWEYDDYRSAMGYAGCSVPKFNAEAVAIRDAAAAHWGVFDRIRAGELPEPQTVEALMELMPELPDRPTAPFL